MVYKNQLDSGTRLTYCKRKQLEFSGTMDEIFNCGGYTKRCGIHINSLTFLHHYKITSSPEFVSITELGVNHERIIPDKHTLELSGGLHKMPSTPFVQIMTMCRKHLA